MSRERVTTEQQANIDQLCAAIKAVQEENESDTNFVKAVRLIEECSDYINTIHEHSTDPLVPDYMDPLRLAVNEIRNELAALIFQKIQDPSESYPDRSSFNRLDCMYVVAKGNIEEREQGQGSHEAPPSALSEDEAMNAPIKEQKQEIVNAFMVKIEEVRRERLARAAASAGSPGHAAAPSPPSPPPPSPDADELKADTEEAQRQRNIDELCAAIESQGADKVAGLIDVCRGYIDMPNSEDGDPPLFWAVFYNYKEALIGLLDAGANINGNYARGMTALHYAAYSGRKEAVEALIEAGANINLKNDAGKTAGQLACMEEGAEKGNRDAIIAAIEEARQEKLRAAGSLGRVDSASSEGPGGVAPSPVRGGEDKPVIVESTDFSFTNIGEAESASDEVVKKCPEQLRAVMAMVNPSIKEEAASEGELKTVPEEESKVDAQKVLADLQNSGMALKRDWLDRSKGVVGYYDNSDNLVATAKKYKKGGWNVVINKARAVEQDDQLAIFSNFGGDKVSMNVAELTVSGNVHWGEPYCHGRPDGNVIVNSKDLSDQIQESHVQRLAAEREQHSVQSR